MKKYILLLICLFFIKVDAFATDACDRLVPQEAYFVWKVTMWSNLRSYPCISKSTIHGVSKVWENYQIISKVDGYYQVKIPNWEIYRIWEKAIVRTNETVQFSNQELEPVKYEVNEWKSIWYQLSSSDKILVNKIMYKIEKLIKQKWDSYRNSMVWKLQEIVNEWEYPDKLIAILDEIKNRIKSIKIWWVVTWQVIAVYDQEDIYDLNNIDISKVKSTWMWWYNDVRGDLWKKAYLYDYTLEKTAKEWSELAKNRWEITHKRNTWDDYYDYSKITSWFKDRWVVCKNIYWVTHTENIGYWTFSCNDSECTDELISWIKSTFDFYMWEKYKDYQAHYNSIINSYFTKMWLWIELEERREWSYKYYLTVHYCTELIR